MTDTIKTSATDWSSLQPDASLRTPLYLQLCSALTKKMTAGALAPGDQLPSERKLAERLSLSRTTILSAYKELESRGLVRSYTGRGTFVSARPERLGAPFAWRGKVSPAVTRSLDMSMRRLVTIDQAGHISFGVGRPALEYFPNSDYLSASQKILTERGTEALNFLPTEGHPELRALIAAREGVGREQVLVVSGSQQALDLISRCLLYPQDTVVMDYPDFMGAIQAFRMSGAALSGWDVSRADLDELEDLFLTRRPKLLYLNPSFQNPTGQTLDLKTRQGILELARTYRVPVVEDDAYRGLHFDAPAPPSLFKLEGDGLVLHLRSFSKTFAPGLRLGYVLADSAIIDQLSLVKAQSDLFSPGLSQLVLAELIGSGVYDRYTALLRRTHLERATTMTRALSREISTDILSYQPPSGGLFLWATLLQGDSEQLLTAALKHSVSFAPGNSFFLDNAGRRALRLCYSGNTSADINEGVKRLALALNEVKP